MCDLADFCKFQTWRVNNLKSGPWDKDGRLDIYKKAELTDDKHKTLLKICNQNGIKFMTSVFNINDIDFISSISAIKLVNLPRTSCTLPSEDITPSIKRSISV